MAFVRGFSEDCAQVRILELENFRLLTKRSSEFVMYIVLGEIYDIPPIHFHRSFCLLVSHGLFT